MLVEMLKAIYEGAEKAVTTGVGLTSWCTVLVHISVTLGKLLLLLLPSSVLERMCLWQRPLSRCESAHFPPLSEAPKYVSNSCHA